MKVEIIVRYNSELTITYNNDLIIGDIIIGNELFSPDGSPDFKVMKPYGSIKVFDKDLRIYNALLNNTLVNESYEIQDDFIVKVEVYLDSKLLGVFEATIKYSIIEKIISFELSNSLSNWDKHKYSGFNFFDWRLTKFDSDEFGNLIQPNLSDLTIEFSERQKDYISSYELYNILVSETEKYEGENSFIIDDEMVEYLTKINICAPNLEVKNLLEAWNYFCSITFTCLYKNYDGKISLVRIC